MEYQTAKNVKFVNKANLKEERNHPSMIFSKHLAFFIPNLGIIKLGILDMKNRKLQIYHHGSYISSTSTNPINKLVDCKLSEPAIGYTRVLDLHTVYCWKLAATYPDYMVSSYDSDVSGAFQQLNYPPDIARRNVSLLGNKIIVSVALHFGGNYGPASLKSIAYTCCFLTQ